MKATIAKLLPVLLLASSCGTGVFLTSGNTDDVYYNPADRQVVITKRLDVASVPQAPARQEALQLPEDSIRVAQRYALVDSTNQEYVEENPDLRGDNNEYYDPNDDYYYSNRINRFYRPSMGFGYYDPFYSGGFGYGMGMGMGMGMGYGGFGYYDPFYSDFYSPFGWGNSFYNPWYGSMYGGYYGMGYNSWYLNDLYWGDWDHNNQGKNERYSYGPRHSMRNDVSGEGRSGGMLKSEPVYARGGGSTSGTGASSLGTGSSSLGTKSATVNPTVAPRSSSDLKSESRPSGYRSSVSSVQNPQARTSISQPVRTNSSSYIRSRTGTTYAQPPVQGSSSLRSSGNVGAENRSSYVRPKTSGSTGSSSSVSQGSSYRSSSSGRSSYSGSSAPRSSGSSYSGGSSYSSGSSSSGRVSSGSYSSGSSSSGRSSSSGSSSSGSSSSSRSGGGSSSGRR